MIVTAQFGAIDIAGKADDIRRWDVPSIGRVLLRTSIEFDRLVTRGANRERAALETSRAVNLGSLREPMLAALQSLTVANVKFVVRQLRAKDLAPGMFLDEDLMSPKGVRLVPSGQEVTRSLIVRLSSIAGGVGVVEPFRVRVPA